MTAPWQAYEEAGISTLPLKPGTKKCSIRGWPDKSPAELWEGATTAANIGVRAGDAGLLVLDCDNDVTAELVLRWLSGLGIDYPPGTLTRRGQHIYLETQIPPDFHLAAFSDPTMVGEVRGWRSYAVAPPSLVSGWRYTPVRDVRQRPLIRWQDVLKLPISTPKTIPPPVKAMTHLLRGTLCAGALELAEAIRLADAGSQVAGFGHTYSSRSEALAVFWRRTLEAGLRPREAVAVLGAIPGRSTRDLEADAARVYGKVLASRSAYSQIAKDAASFSFPGRADVVRNQAKVLRAAATLATQKGGGYLLHGAEVAQVAKLPRQSTVRMMGRLVEAGYLTRAKRGKWQGFFVAVSRGL